MFAVESSKEVSRPKIIRFLQTEDAPDSHCPHCGAKGRYILHFIVEGGRRLAAMRGCAKLWSVSRIAMEELRLLDKEASHKKKGWNGLNKLDSEALAAINKFYVGETGFDERRVLSIIDNAKRANSLRYRR